MVYFSNGQITIRNMEYGDAQAITDAIFIPIVRGEHLEEKTARKSLILAF